MRSESRFVKVLHEALQSLRRKPSTRCPQNESPPACAEGGREVVIPECRCRGSGPRDGTMDQQRVAVKRVEGLPSSTTSTTLHQKSGRLSAADSSARKITFFSEKVPLPKPLPL